MVGYEELVYALAQWRDRQGLPSGESDYLGPERPFPVYRVPHPSASEIASGPTANAAVAEEHVQAEEVYSVGEDDFEEEYAASENEYSEGEYTVADGEDSAYAADEYEEEAEEEAEFLDSDQTADFSEESEESEEAALEAETVDVMSEDAEEELYDDAALDAGTEEISDAEGEALYADAEETMIADNPEPESGYAELVEEDDDELQYPDDDEQY